MTTDSVEQKTPEGCGSKEPEVEWTAENEVNLFYAMRGRRPVGSGRFFHMYFIVEKFSELMGKEIASQTIWDHLDEMYDMDTLHDNTPPHANLTARVEFELPPEFSELKEKRLITEDSISSAGSNVDVKEEKSSDLDVPRSTSTLKSETSSSKPSKVKESMKESVRRDSGSVDAETPKGKKLRQSKGDSVSKASNPSASKKRRQN